MTEEVAERNDMQIGNVGVYNNGSEYKTEKAARTDGFSHAYETQSGKKENPLLGIGFIREPGTNHYYGMSASYAEDYSKDKPVITVSLTKGQNDVEEYNINIKEVNPCNATEIEMFALCSYADANGMGAGGNFGSWQTLNYYRQCAENKGDFILSNTTELCSVYRQNWTDMVRCVMQDYNNDGLYEQSLDGKKLLNMFDNYGCDVNDNMIKEGKNYIEIIHNRIEELYQKIMRRETQPSIPIGKGEYTEKEWNKLIEQFDRVQEEFRKELKLREAKKTEEVKKSIATQEAVKDKDNQDTEEIVNEEDLQALVNESTTCTYPSEEGKQEFFITCYTPEGISCKFFKSPGQWGVYLWIIKYDNAEQYGKVMNFLKNFDSEDNLRFAANERFWKDMLNNRLDEEKFVNYFKSIDTDVADYVNVYEEKYGAYMSPGKV